MIEDKNSAFKRQVMRRVYVVYWFRRLRSSPTVYKVVGFFGVVGINLTVNSAPDVFHNLNHVGQTNGLIAASRYLFNSFIKSELGAQTALVAGGLVAVVVLKDIFKVARAKIRFPLALRFK